MRIFNNKEEKFHLRITKEVKVFAELYNVPYTELLQTFVDIVADEVKGNLNEYETVVNKGINV